MNSVPGLTLPLSRCRVQPLRLTLLLATLFLPVAPAAADFVFMADGYTLTGKLKKEGELFSDQGNEYWVPKVGWVMDDGVRRVYFHQRLVNQAQQDPPNLPPSTETYTLNQPRNPFKPMFHNISLEQVNPWQERGKRSVEIRPSPTGAKEVVEQFVGEVTPTMLRAKGRIHRWDMPLLISEIKPEDLFMILTTHPDALGRNPDAPETKVRLMAFCIQAGWLEQADKLRQELLKSPLPNGQSEQFKALERQLDRDLAFQADQQIQLAMQNGQHQKAQQLLDAARDDAASDAVLVRLRTARLKYKQQSADLEALRRLLGQARKAGKAPALQTAARTVLDEMDQNLNLDTSGRLEVFLKLAQQEERLKAQGREPLYSADQLLALAISGWLLGAKGAEAKEAYAIELCQARDFVQRYLSADSAEERAKVLYQYQRGPTLRVDEIAQLLENLPPILPEPNPSTTPRERVTPASKEWPSGVRYQIKHPPEYHPQRNYPLLIVLPNTFPYASDPKQLLEWWGPLADRYGYLLAIPSWAAPGQKEYQYSTREHAAVLETIRDIRRHESVDGERIALAGFDRAGIMCYDVALSHADQFAAAVVICAEPGRHARNLQNNAQYLPFYVVDGEKDFHRPKESRRLFDYWLLRGFPSVYCEYFQRGYEDYRHELPYAMDWISRKRLAKGLPDLGVEPLIENLGQEMKSIRPTDNRFYWISGQVAATPENPALLTAKQLTGNSFQIKTRNFKQLTIWLSPAMVDFEQPVEIKVNPGSGGPTFKKQVKPSLEVMLEDFHERGDRRSLYFARVDFDFSRR
jgi:predicted esterase